MLRQFASVGKSVLLQRCRPATPQTSAARVMSTARHSGSSATAASNSPVGSLLRAATSRITDASLCHPRKQHGISFFSTTTATNSEAVATEEGETITPTNPKIIESDDGKTYAVLAQDLQRQPKLKPYIVKRRLARMRTYFGKEKNIRHSPWRLNLICQLVAKMTLPEALTQLAFCEKSKAPLVDRILRRTARQADMKHGLQLSQLEVAECFATKGTPLKRIQPMARGRFGQKEHRHAHMRVVLREIDFKLRIYQAPTINQKKKWIQRQLLAQQDGDRARAEREEIERLEREQQEVQEKMKEENK